MISRTVLVAAEPFADGLEAARVAAAIGRGLRAAQSVPAAHGVPAAQGMRADAKLEVDLCAIEGAHLEVPAALKEHLDTIDFDTRMRAARAVVVGTARLDEATLLGSTPFEIATRARQAGVPAYAVAGRNVLSAFDARILDLQVILEASDTRALRRAGARLAALL